MSALRAVETADDILVDCGRYLLLERRDQLDADVVLRWKAIANLMDFVRRLRLAGTSVADELRTLDPQLRELGLADLVTDIVTSSEGQLMGGVLEAHRAMLADRGTTTAEFSPVVAVIAACPSCGRDACEGCSAEPRLRRASDVMRDPPPEEIVEGIAWKDSITVVASESGGGKTFVLLGIAAAVGEDGRRWCGRNVKHGSVAYFSFEGDALGLRLRALQEAQGYSLENVYVMRASEPLSPVIGRDGIEQPSIGEALLVEEVRNLAARLEAEGKPPIVQLVVDTARASMSGDEDRSGDVAAYLRAGRRVLAAAPGAGCIVAHHAGWQDGDSRKKRERGSSAWRGNVDATLYLEVSEEGSDDGGSLAYLTLTAAKVRDGERPAPLRLIRRKVDVLGADRYGSPLSSCIVEHDPRTREDREEAERAMAQEAQRVILLAVLQAIAGHAATTRDALRVFAGGRRDAVYAALDQALRDGLVEHSRRGEPFRLTKAGRQRLESGESSPSSPIVPGDSRDRETPNRPPVPLLRGRGRRRSARG